MEHITLSGHSDVFPLSGDARRRLLDYLQKARATSALDPDGDETVRDIESSIGDQLRVVLSDGTPEVDETAMRRILEQMGPLQPTGGSSRATATASAAASVTASAVPLALLARRAPLLARIHEGKWFGGLTLGVATRGDLHLGWTRTVFFAALLLTGGTFGIFYLVALLFAPRIETAEEYRAMIVRDRQALR